MPNSIYEFGFFDFKNDEIGSSPIGWVHDSAAKATIISGLDGRENVMQVMSGALVKREFETQQSGEIEFYARVNQSSKYFSIYLMDEAGNLAVRAYFHNSNRFQGVNDWYFSGSTSYSINTWYKLKIAFNCSTKKWTMYANDAIVLNDFTFTDNILVGGIKAFAFHNFDTHAGFADQISFSWDEDYKPGDNIMLGCCGDDIIDLRNGLVSEWHFDEGTGLIANDSIGGNDGTINGPLWDSGVYNASLKFDGSNDYVDCGTIGALETFTISGWFRQLGTGNQKWIGLSESDDSKATWIGSGNTGVNNKWDFGVNVIPINEVEITGTEWNHYVLTYDGLTGKAYKNGVFVGETAQTIFSYSNAKLHIGKRAWAASGYFNGLIDEVRIYNRDLSEREVAYLYDMSPYKYIEYPDTFHNGTANVDASYCVNNDFYSSLEETPTTCENAGFNFLTKDWQDYGFKYRKQITIDNSGTTLTDYQININPQTYNTTGLVASYHFNTQEEASIKDYSGNNNHGQLYGSTIGLWRFDEGSGTAVHDSTNYGND
ncbi:MAG: LamG domain-containing protein, partial [Candidatus Gastranaerophilales bacterium]|nr:LamG domain-containing protein [Candidatus Gastranaerophilales bacterium]